MCGFETQVCGLFCELFWQAFDIEFDCLLTALFEFHLDSTLLTTFLEQLLELVSVAAVEVEGVGCVGVVAYE